MLYDAEHKALIKRFEDTLKRLGYDDGEWIYIHWGGTEVQLDGNFTAEDLRKIAQALDEVQPNG